jgi:glycosyltransferase involved in cell wall biosynthesis
MESNVAVPIPPVGAPLRRLSVVIASYNYERFVGDAIDSALSIDWPDIEVIVIDDGSTDGSRAVIERYGSRIRRHDQANHGHLEVYNVGFGMSTGDAILFLDADDVAAPDLMRAVEAVWHPGVSKVQFQMRSVDADLRPTGSCFPQYPKQASGEDVRRWMRATSTYPTAPGSGNVYSRWFLQMIFPLSSRWGRSGDSCCIAAAPLHGDVVTIPLPLMNYRVHGANAAAMASYQPGRFGRELQRAIDRYRYADEIGRSVGHLIALDAWRISLHALPYRIPSWRLDRAEHPVPSDGRLVLLHDLFRGWRQPQGVPGPVAAALVLWGCAVLFAPRGLAMRLALWRHVPQARPRLIGHLLARFGIVRDGSADARLPIRMPRAGPAASGQ